MAGNPKKAVDLKAIGERLEFNDARERTNGQRSEGILTLAAGGSGPPAHRHLHQSEGFQVLSGSLLVTVEGQAHTVSAGETMVVRPGQAHCPRNASEIDPLVVRFWFEPALRIEWMLQTLGEVAVERGGSWNRVPLLVLAHVFFGLRKEYRLAGMPYWLQDAAFGLLSGVARVTGVARKVAVPPA